MKNPSGTLRFPVVIHEKNKLIGRAKGGDEEAELLLKGEVAQQHPALVRLSDFRVQSLMVGAIDRTDQYRTALEIGLPLDIEVATDKAFDFNSEKQAALARVAELGTHMDLPKLRQILEESLNEEEQTAVEEAIKAIEAK